MNILVNGCSFTANSDQWPCYFSLPHTNISKAGNSNESIFLTTVEELQKNHYDCCVLMWSSVDRYLMSTVNHELKNILPNSPISFASGDDYLNPGEVSGKLIERALEKFKKDYYRYFYSEKIQQQKLQIYKYVLSHSCKKAIHLSVTDVVGRQVLGHPTAKTSKRFAQYIMETYFNE